MGHAHAHPFHRVDYDFDGSYRESVGQEIGTPDQQQEAVAACGSDAHLYCKALKETDGPYAYLSCLELNG